MSIVETTWKICFCLFSNKFTNVPDEKDSIKLLRANGKSVSPSSFLLSDSREIKGVSFAPKYYLFIFFLRETKLRSESRESSSKKLHKNRVSFSRLLISVGATRAMILFYSWHHRSRHRVFPAIKIRHFYLSRDRLVNFIYSLEKKCDVENFAKRDYRVDYLWSVFSSSFH